MEWISVKDRLPDPMTSVLAYSRGSIYQPDDYPHCEVLGYDPDVWNPGWSFVTHWMPLPEPPEV